jgi:hypothetical protein
MSRIVTDIQINDKSILKWMSINWNAIVILIFEKKKEKEIKVLQLSK